MTVEPITDERLAELRADAGHKGVWLLHLDAIEVRALLSRLDKAEAGVEIMTALTRTPLYSYRALAERLSQIMGARFGARFMDPPDGGDVPIHEQVERMADALLAAERPSES
jgi:hypothetical protein